MINSLQTCDSQTTTIFNSIKGKTINDAAIPAMPASIPATPGWFQASTGTSSIGAVYEDTTDATYNYGITIAYKYGGCTNPVADCTCIQKFKTDKNNIPAADTTLPASVITNALNSLPIAGAGSNPSCGTGLWDGCVMGIQNKYLIAGGGGLLALYIISKL